VVQFERTELRGLLEQSTESLTVLNLLTERSPAYSFEHSKRLCVRLPQFANRKPPIQKEKTMKVLIFGATGTVGFHLVEQSLAAGHCVTAFVRSPAKLKISDPNLSVVVGDVLRDTDRVMAAIAGQDVVLVALGAGLRGRVRSEGTRNIVDAMERILASNLTRRVDFALFMVNALEEDDLIHEAPAIVGCQTPSAIAHAEEK
jgi:hypothetical protein